MSLRINQNTSAFSAHRFLTANDASMSKSIEKLSSGLRINSAADDAAGLVISETLRTQVSGIGQATRNTQDGINMIKTAEAALNEVESQLRNMRDLTLHAANANGNKQMLAADQAQVAQAATSIDRIAKQTEFAGLALLGGADGTKSISGAKFQIGANTGQTATFELPVAQYDGVGLTADMRAQTLGVTAGSATVAKVTTGTNVAATATAGEVITISGALGNASVTVTAGDTTATTLGAINAQTTNTGVKALLTKADGSVSAFTAENTRISFVSSNAAGTAEATGSTQAITVVSTAAATNGIGIGKVAISATGTTGGIDLTAATPNFDSIVTGIDNALKQVNGLRVNLGAFQKNNLESNLSSLAVAKENLAASESAIRDTDMASEMVSFTKSQILTQAAQAMLTQANQAPQNILQMLR